MEGDTINSLINDYRTLHQIPEVGHDLPLTKSYLLKQLKNTTSSIYEIGQSSIVAVFDFGFNNYIAFRSEMDALPIQEDDSHQICSAYTNRMHACAHDAHMTILLQLAYYLSNTKSSKYNIILIFEEAEEIDGNAKQIIDFLNSKNYEINHFFCMHLWPNLEFGILHSNHKTLMAEAHEIIVEISGKSSHISSTSYSQDALLAGCTLINEIAKHLDYIMLNNTHYRFGYIQSGSSCNVISNKTIIKGSCRTLDSIELKKLQKQIKLLSENIDMKYHTSTSINYSKGYCSVRNSTKVFRKIEKQIPIKSISPLFTCESAGEYLKKYNGCYLLLGMGESAPLHSSYFKINEDLLTIGFDYYLKLLSI